MSLTIGVGSDPTVDFTGSLAQNAAAQWRKALPAALGARSLVKSIVIQSVENLDWEIMAFRRSNFNTIPAGGTIGDISLAFKYRFFAADGVQIAGAGPYYYYIDGLEAEYIDANSVTTQQQPNTTVPAANLAPFINVLLINRSAAAKTAGANGAIVVRLYMEPCNG